MRKSRGEGVGRKCDEMIDCSVSAFVFRFVVSFVLLFLVCSLPVSLFLRSCICLIGEKADERGDGHTARRDDCGDGENENENENERQGIRQERTRRENACHKRDARTRRKTRRNRTRRKTRRREPRPSILDKLGQVFQQTGMTEKDEDGQFIFSA